MTAAERTFADTNVFVYAADEGEPAKRARAREVLASYPAGTLVVSTQVLGEFYTVVTRRIARPLSLPDGAEAVRRLSAYPVVPVDAELVRAGVEIHRAHQVSYWDGLILAAARTAGCTTLLTEDLHAGATLAGITIENPFAGT